MKKFKAPKDKDGNQYWVPIVVKDKDTIVSFITGVNSIIDAFSIDKSEVSLMFGSDRFNDILPNGTRVGDMTDDEIVRYINEHAMREEEPKHVENCKDILSEYYLSVDCTCGMFYGFNNIDELPSKDFACGVCDKKVIMYTNKSDSYYIYDGSTKIDLLTSPNPELSPEAEKLIRDNSPEDIEKLLKDVLEPEDYYEILGEDEDSPDESISSKTSKDSGNQEKINKINFELNKKIARVEVLDRLLSLGSIDKVRRAKLVKESKGLAKEIDKLIIELDGLTD